MIPSAAASTMLSSMAFEVSIFPHCDGSCRFVEDGTFVIVTVVGPQHVSEKHQSHDPERGALELRCQLADRAAPDRALIERRIEENVSSIINRALDFKKFPRQIITVAILVVLNDGAATRLALNAAVLALLDATIPFLLIPLTVDYGDSRQKSGGLVTLDAATQEILAFDSAGIIDLDNLDLCFEIARTLCARLLEFIQSSGANDTQNAAMLAVYEKKPSLDLIASLVETRDDVKEFLSSTNDQHLSDKEGDVFMSIS